jgi:CheY-like chemotaxis protein
MRARVVEILEKEFYLMAAVAVGNELIHAARILRPDVIVRDVMMPQLSRPEAKERLVETGVDIPFVFLTTDCPGARRTWRDLNPCIKKTDLVGELTPAVRNAALRGGMKSLRQTCGI